MPPTQPTRPRLGAYLGVYLLALRHPVPAARQIVTLAQLPPGRLALGIGVGHRHMAALPEANGIEGGRR